MAKKKAAKKSGKKSGSGAGAKGRGPGPAVDPVTFGTLLAAVIAGPPLWSLYQDANIDLSTALLHGELVAVGCGIGIAGVNRLIADYRVQVDRDQRIQQVLDAIEGVVHEGLPIPPSNPPPTPTSPPTPTPTTSPSSG